MVISYKTLEREEDLYIFRCQGYRNAMKHAVKFTVMGNVISL